MRDALRLAVGTLSVLPLPVTGSRIGPGPVDRAVAGRAMILAPVVGLLLGGLAAVVGGATQALRPDAPVLSAVLGVLVLTVLSGALHLDGLADTADGLGSRRDRETMLRIMRQGDIGPFGVVVLVGVLLIDVAALSACVQAGIGWQALVIGTTASRLTVPWSCRSGVPSARPEGLGATVAGTVRPIAAALLTLGAAAAAVVLLWATTPACPAALIGGGAAVAVTVIAGLAMVRRATTAFGGITGDVLGAAVELGLAASLITLALVVTGC